MDILIIALTFRVEAGDCVLLQWFRLLLLYMYVFDLFQPSGLQSVGSLIPFHAAENLIM